MNAADERKVNPMKEMLRMIKDVSNLDAWGFSESYRSDKDKRLVYDSEWCRIKLIWGGWDYGKGNSINIYYGRLHAPNESTTMIWNGEECHAWHKLRLPLLFLDGDSPDKAARMKASAPLTSKYYEEKYLQKFYRRQPEWLVTMHMEVWEHYGKRFFELFDLRRPDLWERYRQFLKEYYDIKGRSSFIKPSFDKVC
jgi:hypothetical protein